MTDLEQRVVHKESNSSGSYDNKGYLLQKSDPKELHRQGGRVEELTGGSCGLRGHDDPGMTKVLVEIDQETHVVGDFWRHAREVRQSDGGAHQLLEAAAKDH